MKKLLSILLLPLILFLASCGGGGEVNPLNPPANSMYTYIPSTAFEQKLIQLGLDDLLDDYVLTTNINDLTSLTLNGLNISDLTGIENFTSLQYLELRDCNLSEIDLSNNSELFYLDCSVNNITSLDLSNCIKIHEFQAFNNDLEILDFGNNTELAYIDIEYNNLSSLDISNNTNVRHLKIFNNQLTSLNLKNNNANWNRLNTINNPNLNCIEILDSVGFAIELQLDTQHYFSEDCP